MPMLFWLPTVFMGAFLEMTRIANENRERSLTLFGEGADANVASIEPYSTYQRNARINEKQQYSSGDVVPI